MTSTNTVYEDSLDALTAGITGAYSLVVLVLAILLLVATWKVYKKAGKPGWASLIPFYSQYCLFDITFGNGWLFLLTFVPCVNVIFSIMATFKLAKAFGKGTGFGFGLLFLNPIFMLILGLGDSEYLGPQ